MLQSVDDLVAGVVAALRETGELDHTYVVYTSDNGWHMGEHRQFVGKTTAYGEDMRVPFAIRGPGVQKGARLPPFGLNNTLPPTLAALAAVAQLTYAAGRPSLPPLEHPHQSRRQHFAMPTRPHPQRALGRAR